MKKLLATVCAAALLWAAFPAEAPAMPVAHGTLKGNLITPFTSSTYVSTHSTVASQSTFTWNTVTFGSSTSNRKIGIFVTSRVASGSPANIVSATIGGNAAYVFPGQTNTLNSIHFIIAESLSGDTNQSVSVTFNVTCAQASIMVYAIFNAKHFEPTDYITGTTDNVALNSYVAPNGILLCGLVAQSTVGGVTWTNATENIDAIITGTTTHSAASFASAVEVPARAVTADVGNTVTDLARLNVSFQPDGGYPFLAKRAFYSANTSSQSSYSFLNANINGESTQRKVIIFVAWYWSSVSNLASITVDGVAPTQLYVSNGGTTNTDIGVFIINQPTGNDCDIVVNFDANVVNCSITVMSLYAAASSTPHDSANGTSDTGGVKAETDIDIPNHGVGYCVSHLGTGLNFTSTFTGITPFVENYTSNMNTAVGYTNWMASESNRDMGCAWNNSNLQRTFAMSFL